MGWGEQSFTNNWSDRPNRGRSVYKPTVIILFCRQRLLMFSGMVKIRRVIITHSPIGNNSQFLHYCFLVTDDYFGMSTTALATIHSNDLYWRQFNILRTHATIAYSNILVILRVDVVTDHTASSYDLTPIVRWTRNFVWLVLISKNNHKLNKFLSLDPNAKP